MSGEATACPACGLWHGRPNPCGHDCTLPCFTCGRARGLRFTADDGKPGGRAIECFRCHWKLGAAA